MSWPMVPLGECCDVIGGGTPRTTEPEYWDGGIPWATPRDLGDLDSLYISETSRTISKEGLASCGARVLSAQSVLLSSRAPIGLVAINVVPMATNQGFKSLVPGPQVHAPYLAHWLIAHRVQLEHMGSGATFREISKRIVEKIELPLPSFDEQRRLSSIMDKADWLRKKRRKANIQWQRSVAAIFLKMFGDPGANPMGWKLVPLGALAEKFSDGPFGSNLKSEHYVGTGVRVVRLQNIGVGKFLDESKVFISNNHFRQLRKHECQPGDVLIATLGDPNLRACQLPSAVPVALNKADCVQMRVDPTKADPRYVTALLNQPGILIRAQMLMAGQTRVRISMGRLRHLDVPLPPLSTQRQFGAILEKLGGITSKTDSQLVQFDKLFVALQSRAFAA